MFSNVGQLMQLLKEAKKVAPVLTTKDVNIEGAIIPSDTENLLKESKHVLQGKIPYNVESYDCKWLMDTTIEKIKEAQQNGKPTITLENRCCTQICPEMTFMLIIVNKLKGTDDPSI